MSPFGKAASVAACVALSVLVTLPAKAWEGGARAEETIEHANLDTTYGRVDGDVGVSFGAGGTFGPRGPRGTLDLRLRYLDTAGIFFFYEDGLSATSSDPRRVLGAGFEVRPLFIGRWLLDDELRIPRLDLFLDSFGLELATFFEQPALGAFGARPGLQVSLGLEVPILARASGPWVGLHGGLRWSDPAIGVDAAAGPASRSAFLSVTLAYHQIFAAHLVDANDAAPR
jgi:hypothetical protein